MIGLDRHRRAFYALLLAEFISITGNAMTLIAVPWYVLQTTDSASLTGLAGFFFFLPVGAAGVFGGVFVDRLGFRRSSVIADIFSGLTVAMIPLFDQTVGLPFVLLLVLVFLGSMLDTPGITARYSMLPDLAERAGVPLERANAAHQIVNRGGQLAGAPLAGVLIALIGASSVLWVDAATFGISALIVALVVPRVAVQREEGSPRSAGYIADLREGFRFLYGDRLLLWLCLIVGALNFLDIPLGSLVLPVFADRVLDSAVALGVIFGAGAGASILGALVYGWIGPRLPRWQTFGLSFLLTGLPIWLLAFSPPLAVLLLPWAIRGLASGPLNPILMTTYQERIPPAMRGRAFGAMTAVSWGANPLGLLCGGLLLEAAGLSATIFVIAGIYLLLTTSILLNPVFREMNVANTDRRSAKESVEVAGV